MDLSVISVGKMESSGIGLIVELVWCKKMSLTLKSYSRLYSTIYIYIYCS